MSGFLSLVVRLRNHELSNACILSGLAAGIGGLRHLEGGNICSKQRTFALLVLEVISPRHLLCSVIRPREACRGDIPDILCCRGGLAHL